jgi:hypothetical protein
VVAQRRLLLRAIQANNLLLGLVKNRPKLNEVLNGLKSELPMLKARD